LLKLEKKHIKPISLVLSRAFKDDLKDVFPDPEERRMKAPYVNEFYLLLDYSEFRAFLTSPELEGIAVWIHSEKKKGGSFWRILTSGAIRPAIKVGIRAHRKFYAINGYIEKKHRELAPETHWYLAILAADPQYQGNGYASKLLNGML
jgi:ribosomal protein S18 acetylase RimI-like enzyme